jgi:hypothetical protein
LYLNLKIKAKDIKPSSFSYWKQRFLDFYGVVLDVKGSIFFGSKSSTNLICSTMPRLAQPVEISRAPLFSTSDTTLLVFFIEDGCYEKWRMLASEILHTDAKRELYVSFSLTGLGHLPG